MSKSKLLDWLGDLSKPSPPNSYEWLDALLNEPNNPDSLDWLGDLSEPSQPESYDWLDDLSEITPFGEFGWLNDAFFESIGDLRKDTPFKDL